MNERGISMETQDAHAPAPESAVSTMGQAKALKTIDLGIEGLTPAVHLGAGGSANVFAAKRIDTGEAVAVKLLRASADSEKERIRFEREQETLQRLATHDGIVPVLDAGMTDREEPYFLMPLMEGSLQDRIDREGALDWQTATQLVAEVADTVAFAHDHQVLHRDLKPGNVLLDGEGVPRVADFGIAKLVDSSVSKSSKSLGTPSFMPPERFNGHEATEETDVYGLGATLAALITGSAPFLTGENDTDVAVMMRVVTEEPPSLDGHGVPDEVRDAVQASMAKDPADRPATASDFAQRLRMAIDPHLDPALAGPVTVAIPRRNITIPDAPVTGGKGSTITIEDEDDDRRKVPVWLMAAAAMMLVAVLGAVGLNALLSDPETEVAGEVLTNENGEAEGEATSDAAGATDGLGDEGEGQASLVDGEDATADGGDDATSGGDNDGAAIDSGSDGEGGDASTGGDGNTDGSDGGTTGTDDGATGGGDDGAGDDGAGTGGLVENPTKEDPVDEKEEAPAPAKPTACFGASASKVETGQTVSFSNCSTDATSYSWDLAGTSSSSTNASASWTTAGPKTIRLTATGPGGTHSATKTVTVSETPPPPVEPSACFNASPLTVETGDKVTLSNCSTDATSYSWSFGDGTSSTSKNATKSWTTAGSKTVRLTATGPGGTNTVTKTITVTAPAPAADACFTASKSTIEAGQSVTFSNCSKNATSYSWSFGDGGSSSQASPTHTFNSAGSYTVRLTAKGAGGDDTATRTITVNAKVAAPDACFTASATTIDAGKSVTFTNCSKNASSYSWSFGDGGTSSQASPTHTFNSAGSYTVKLTAKGAGGEDTASKTITVNAKITPQFTDRVEIGQINDDNIRFRFTTNVSTGYSVRVTSGGTTVKSFNGTATANQATNATASGLTPGTDYKITVTLNTSPSVSSSADVRTSGSNAPAPTTQVQLLNLRVVDTQATRFEFKYESNICANGSFVIREKGGAQVGSNAGQANGCTNTHLGIPGFWTAALKPGTTYQVTVTVEANGQGKGGGNTASKTIEVTTAS